MAARSAVSEVLAYNVKLWAAGLGAALFVPLSLVALVLDVVSLRTQSPDALSRRVLRASARFEAALDLHGPLTDVRLTTPPEDPSPGDGGGAGQGVGRALPSSPSAYPVISRKPVPDAEPDTSTVPSQ